MKGHIGLTIDTDIIENFRDLVGHGNISKNVQDYMQSRISSHSTDLGNQKIEIIKKKKAILESRKNKLDAEYKTYTKLIENHELRQQQEKEESLKEEEKLIKARTFCNVCGFELDETRLNTELKGWVHQKCYDKEKHGKLVIK